MIVSLCNQLLGAHFSWPDRRVKHENIFSAAVVGGAVVVAKTLLQTQKSGVKPVIAQLARMVDRVTVPPARAAILWLLGEHCERLPHLPPDVLRKMAKTFPNEVSCPRHESCHGYGDVC